MLPFAGEDLRNRNWPERFENDSIAYSAHSKSDRSCIGTRLNRIAGHRYRQLEFSVHQRCRVTAITISAKRQNHRCEIGSTRRTLLD
jgi:hypothetical protein